MVCPNGLAQGPFSPPRARQVTRRPSPRLSGKARKRSRPYLCRANTPKAERTPPSPHSLFLVLLQLAKVGEKGRKRGVSSIVRGSRPVWKYRLRRGTASRLIFLFTNLSHHCVDSIMLQKFDLQIFQIFWEDRSRKKSKWQSQACRLCQSFKGRSLGGV